MEKSTTKEKSVPKSVSKSVSSAQNIENIPVLQVAEDQFRALL